MRRFVLLFSAAIGLAVIVQSKVGNAQDAGKARIGTVQQPSDGRPPRNFGTVSGLVSILKNETVIEDFGFTAKQVATLKELDLRRMAAALGRKGEGDPEVRNARVKIDAILRPEQRKRLDEYIVQAWPISALQDAALQKALSITEEQRSRLDVIGHEYGRELKGIVPGPNVEGYLGSIAELNRDALATMMLALTDDQKNSFGKLKGRQLDVDWLAIVSARQAATARNGGSNIEVEKTHLPSLVTPPPPRPTQPRESVPRGEPLGPSTMQKWEYKLVQINSVEDAEQELNKLGAEGWKYIDAMGNLVVFERPKQSTPPETGPAIKPGKAEVPAPRNLEQ